CVGLHSCEADMLLPREGRRKYDSVGNGDHLAARGELLWETQQGTNRAKRVASGVVLIVILDRQTVSCADHVIHCGDSLIHAGVRVGPLEDGVVAERLGPAYAL